MGEPPNPSMFLQGDMFFARLSKRKAQSGQVQISSVWVVSQRNKRPKRFFKQGAPLEKLAVTQ